MRTLIALLTIFFVVSLSAQDWTPFTTVEGNILCLFFNLENPYYTMAGTDDGLYIDPEFNSTFLELNLPVKSFAPMDATHCLFIMGDGSWSDGIYELDMESQYYDVMVYSPWPYFMEKDLSTGIYYAGAEYGLYTSEDGTNWDAPGDDEGARYDIAFWDTHIAIAGEYCIYHSADGGENWDTYPISLDIRAITYDPSGILYGAFGDVSDSSGLWSSTDNGENWTVEFYSEHLNTVDWNWSGEIFVGWNPPTGTESEGIAVWFPDIWDLVNITSDLPNTRINSITTHPLIDCENVIACTEDGAYMNTSWFNDTEEVTDPEATLRLTNYPNPFNPETTISFTLDKPSFCEMSIYNVRGQRIVTLVQERLEAGPHAIVWDGDSAPSGMYLCRLKTDSDEVVRKLAMIK